MRQKKEQIILYKQKSKTLVYLIFGIIVFLLVFFPLYGFSLKFQLGIYLRKIFDIIGVLCLTFGGFLLILCIASLFLGRSARTRTFIVAVVLIWVGCWMSGIAVELFGFTLGNKEAGTGGYN